jgi:signal peptidase I
MRTHRTKIAGAIAAAVVFLGLWTFFAPTKLGGSTTYSITDGISMEPLLYKNDLAVVRPQSSYHVGEVVLYENQLLHRDVLHRVYLIQNGNYFFKGENNDFVDPGYATRDEIVGALWFHIPGVGAVLGWFAKPLHAGVLAALTAMAVVLTAAPVGKGRRRRRRGRTPRERQVARSMIRQRTHKGLTQSTVGDRRAPAGMSAETSSAGSPRSPDRERRSGIAMTLSQTARRRPPRYLEGPTSTLVTAGVLSALAIIFLLVGFSRPLQTVAPIPAAYQQTGSFSYSAPVITPTDVYPSGSVTTGQPIYPALVDTVILDYKYKFTSPLPHHITGTVELKALLLSTSDTWQDLSVITPTRAFTGNSTSVVSSLPLKDLYTLVNNVAAGSGIAGVDYSADIQPVVHIVGTVGGKKINSTFSPVLPFTVTQSSITLNDAVAPAPPGATYVAPSASSGLASTLNPVQTGSVPHQVANVFSFAKYDIKVPLLRLLGIIFGALAVASALLHDVLRRRKTMRSDEELIARRLHSFIVPVVSLALPDDAALIDVPDFPHLAGLAQFLERPILYQMSNNQRTYAVDDDRHRYVYRPREDPSTAPPPSADTPSGDLHVERLSTHPTSRNRTHSRLSTVVRASAGVLLLAVTATLVTSFTASTSVPTSHAGEVVEARAISELTPPGCSSLTLTSLVEKSGTFTNNASNALILGSAGVDKITDTGSRNCIVGGAGKDTVTGTSTDICIIGPTSGATYSKCAT